MGKEEKEKTAEERFLKALNFIAEGYGGFNSKGKVVDRRIDVDAMPIPANKKLGVPEPKEVNAFAKKYKDAENRERVRLLNSNAVCSDCGKKINPIQANWKFKNTWIHIHSDGTRHPVVDPIVYTNSR